MDTDILKDNTNKKDKKSKKRIIILSSIITIIVIAVIYLSVSVYFQYFFLKGTTINGIDCSFKSAEAVKEILEDNIRTYYLQIVERNNTIEHVTAEDIKLQMTIDGDIEKLLKEQNSYGWLFSKGGSHTVETTVTYDESALNSRFNTLACLDEEKMTDASPPEITYSDGTYTVGTLNPGTRVDTQKLKAVITEAVSNMESEVNIEKEGLYLVNSNDSDEKYTMLVNTLNKYVGVTITLTFNGELDPVVIDESIISGWLSVDSDCNIVFDTEAIEAFVGNISKDIETMGQSRVFTNSYGNEINISGGDYGWWISEGTEAEAIINDIKGGTDVERELNYLQTAASHGDNDLGDTYIEINLMTQHLFCYKEGSLITECDIISGSNSNPTPTGIYRMRFMFTNYTFNRAYFNRTVPYWMVFYGNDADTNIGIVGCDWRNDFGGTTYLYNGSYGSIYIPNENAAVIYREIPNDIPVIIYKGY